MIDDTTKHPMLLNLTSNRGGLMMEQYGLDPTIVAYQCTGQQYGEGKDD